MNEELIVSAVSFLKDPNVAASPLTKKVEFLESKGLSQIEIEEALKRANGQVATTSSVTTSSSPQSTGGSYPPIDYYNAAPPPLPERSWKDYFIMATAAAGVSYGLYQVVSKYIIPSIIPPSQTSIEKDMEKIDEEFIKIDKLLEQLTTDQAEIKDSNETKLREIDTVINNVNDFLSKYNKDKLSFDDDLRLMKLEIDNLRNSVEKNMANTKENIADELKEISEELTSLKQIIVSTNASGNESRKLPPVSSIPSASEILKRAREKKESTPPAPVQAPAQTALPAPATASASAPANKPASPSISTPNKVFAVGIPEWQLEKKLEEEENDKKVAEREQAEREAKRLLDLQEKERKEINDAFAAAKASESQDSYGVPAWQRSAKPSGEDEEVAAAIANVGVPSWQLNSSA